MSVKLIQNFEYLESFSLNGNAAISTVHKFGNKSVAFSGADDYVSVSNNSGIFNINSESVRNFECFFNPTADLATINWNDNGFFLFNGHAFKFFNNSLTWHDAKTYCEAMGGHLATSTSNDKNNFLSSMTNGNHTWLGATDELNEGSWIWVTGEEWSYSNWNLGDGQPNNAGNNQHYLSINDTGYNALWADDANNTNIPFICEWDNLNDAYFALNGYHFFNGHSFKLFMSDNAISWHDAKSFCVHLGGHLATSTSLNKNNFLASISDNKTLWLGATDENDEGNWRWINGEIWDFSLWNSGQPSSESDEHFLVLYPDGLWRDEPVLCQHISAFFCEWDADFRSLGFLPGYIFNFDNGLSLMLNHDAALRLLSEQANIDVASTAAVTPDSWHHLSLSFHNSMAYVYLDGNLVLSAPFMNINFSPTTFSLGGFSGYIDEFAVRVSKSLLEILNLNI